MNFTNAPKTADTGAGVIDLAPFEVRIIERKKA
jgi:hypothetical protein